MSYNSIVEIAQSESLRGRITAAAAAEGIDYPEQWASTAMWKLAASPGWADKWDSANDSYTVNANPDTGARTDVISDGDILSAVQALPTA
jgi:hypothetical protein